MDIGKLFKNLPDARRELINRGISLESLKQEYNIIHNILYPFSDNYFLFCSDDSGTPCLTIDEYKKIKNQLNNISLACNDKKFLDEYLESRIRKYRSPRRGACVALRGASYYRMIEETDNKILFRYLQNDFLADSKVYRFISRISNPVPKEIVFLVVEHLKNTIFRIMYAYLIKSLNEHNFFRETEWYLLDGFARTLWEVLVNIILKTDYLLQTQLRFEPIFEVMNRVSDGDFKKVRELDSAKTLLRMAEIFYRNDPDFDFCVPLLYGGIEIAYSFYAYGLYSEKTIFRDIIPVVFSLNRLKKGNIPMNSLGRDGLIRWDKMHKVIPEYFLVKLQQQSIQSKLFVVDNNITTGYSLRVVTESLRKKFDTCHAAVAEINIQEIQQLCQGNLKKNGKAVVLRGNDLYHQPVGEYVTCFGFKDKSRVVDRIKVVLGHTNHTQIEGYDFDNTLFQTNAIHRLSWNKALKNLGIDFDVKSLPSNSGLTYKQAAANIYFHLKKINKKIKQPEELFIKRLVEDKTRFMMEISKKDIIPIAKTVNLITSDVANTKILITNNRLDFVVLCLKAKRLFKYFSYLICDDYALCIKSGEKVAVIGKRKPEVDCYREASDYFKLQQIQTYYGDDDKIDREFARRLKCEFVLIK